ncbi:MAG: FkbM family methyltransferase, partial [Candidatus Staskawiczbacteria bacterium]|nr:FkbM family methyltransferase [Candidatus Staskawiczbacteria bacterium]
MNNIKTFIDIGAHDGSFIDACLKFYPNAIVYAFEPTPNNAEKISKEFPKINVFNFGLWNENANKRFYLNQVSSRNSFKSKT